MGINISSPEYGGAWQVSHEQNVPPWFSIRRWNVLLASFFDFFRFHKVLINAPTIPYTIARQAVHLFSYSRPAIRRAIIIVNVAYQLVNAINQTALHFILVPLRYSPQIRGEFHDIAKTETI